MKADARRDICYNAHEPDAASAARRDERVLSVELRRRLLPTADDELPPSPPPLVDSDDELAARPPLPQYRAPHTRQLAAFVRRGRTAVLAGEPLSMTREAFSDAEVRRIVRSFAEEGQKFGRLVRKADFCALRDRLADACSDSCMAHISRLLRTGDYSAVRYSATNGRSKGLGTGIFVVHASVKKYILDGLERCVQSA